MSTGRFKQSTLGGLVSTTSFCFFFLLTLNTGCNQEPVYTGILLGRWNVYGATRSGRATSTLKDAYFHFVNDTLLLSNILREEQHFQYKLDGDKIVVNGPLETTYSYKLSGADSLKLYGEIQGYNFGFFTVRDSIEITNNELEPPLN